LKPQELTGVVLIRETTRNPEIGRLIQTVYMVPRDWKDIVEEWRELAAKEASDTRHQLARTAAPKAAEPGKGAKGARVGPAISPLQEFREKVNVVFLQKFQGVWR